MLCGLTTFVGTESHFFVDEAAHYAQIDLVADGTWLVERPLANVDLTGEHAPMDRAQLSGPDEYAPFVNHPLSVWIGVSADRVGGSVGVRAVSVLGALGAAAAAAALAERFRAGTGVLALWLTGLASPLVFDSQLIVAHTLGAAVVGGAAIWWLSDRSTPVVAVGLAAAAFVAVLLRSEAMLLAASVALVGGVLAVRRRDLALAARVVAVTAGGVVAYLIEPVWIGRIVDAPNVGPRTISSASRGGLEGRIEALETVLVRPAYEGLTETSTNLLLFAAVALAVVGAVLAARSRLDLARPILVAAIAMAVIRLAEPAVTPGLLLAFPAITVAAALVAAGVHRPRRTELAVLSVAGIFATAVAVTQYQEAGGFEWGWRYVAIALPLVVPTVAITLRSLQHRVGGRAGTSVVVAVVAVSVLVAASGVLEQRAVIDRTDRLHHDLEALAVDQDRLLFLDPLLGRAMWQLSISGQIVQSEAADAVEVLGWMRDEGDDAVLLVWVGGDAAPISDDGIEVGPVIDLGVAGLRAAPLRL